MHDPDVVAFEIKRPWRKRVTPTWAYRPAIVTFWHQEPGGADALTVCGKGRWKWHLHHMRVQVLPVQEWRRRLLTRCEWCGGRSTKSDPVNVSHQWDRDRTPLWRGERGLYHSDCSSVDRAHRTCLCAVPVLQHSGYGKCLVCDRFRAYGDTPERLAPVAFIVANTEPHQRMDVETRQIVRSMWDELRAGDAS